MTIDIRSLLVAPVLLLSLLTGTAAFAAETSATPASPATPVPGHGKQWCADNPEKCEQMKAQAKQ